MLKKKLLVLSQLLIPHAHFFSLIRKERLYVYASELNAYYIYKKNWFLKFNVKRLNQLRLKNKICGHFSVFS